LTEKLKLSVVYGLTALFIALNCYLITKDIYWSLVLPVFIYLLILYIVSLDKVLLIIAFLTPLAINIQDFEYGVGVSLPTEPLMFGVLLIFIFKMLHDSGYDQRIVRHPVSLAIIFMLVWMLITSITSDIPMVSFKYLLSRIWFVVPFYFVGIMLFKRIKNIRLFNWLYVLSLIIVIVYTILNHASYGFDEDAGHWVMNPFYNDHTAYGAILALFIPVYIGFSLNRNYSKWYRFFSIMVTGVLILALILSYSRAAWISLAGAIVVYMVILLKIKFKYLLGSFILILLIFFTFSFEILDKLEKNKQDSSADLVEHVHSISNITTDASNLERINRWQSALRLFEERPVFGWGPGTYQFVYAPYQRSKDKTIISTNAGDMGNAHSEYIGPLAEMGVLGMVAILVIMVTVIYTGLRVYKYATSNEVKMLSMITVLGLVTYFIHGLLNNFLDTDKLSVPFWGFIAILVSLDLFYVNKKKPNIQEAPIE